MCLSVVLKNCLNLKTKIKVILQIVLILKSCKDHRFQLEEDVDALSKNKQGLFR